MGNSCGRADAARRIARRPTVESSVEAAAPVLSTIHSLAASCDGALTSSLDANTTAATSRATVAASATICTIQETVHAYVASVRRRARAALKQLEAREEECVDTIKSLESCVQQLLANDGCVEFLEGSLEAVARILDSADVFPRVSTVITSAAHSPSLLLDYVRSGMSRIDNGIDPTHCKVIYPRWLLRKVSNMVTISLCDVVGQPVYGVTPSDVSVSISSEAVGWTVSPVSVVANVVSFWVKLSLQCSHAATLNVHIGSVDITLSLKAVATPEAVAAARVACARYLARIGRVPHDELTSLVTACAAAASSLQVAHEFCIAVSNICTNNCVEANLEACAAAGVIPAVVAAMAAHGAVDASFAARGCRALMVLSRSNRMNADAVVLSSGGLDAIVSVMAAHPDDVDVQEKACAALFFIASGASPAAKHEIRESAAVELLRSARRNHPTDGHWTVKGIAEQALSSIGAGLL